MTVEVHNPDQTESKPLNTELETLAPELTAEHNELSPETHPTRQTSDDAGHEHRQNKFYQGEAAAAPAIIDSDHGR